MELDLTVDLILHAIKKENENKAWQMWIAKYQHMKEENFVPFSEFYKEAIKPKPQKKNDEEVESELLKVVRAYEKAVK